MKSDHPQPTNPTAPHQAHDDETSTIDIELDVTCTLLALELHNQKSFHSFSIKQRDPDNEQPAP